jgi:RHS repeat-associated protein
MRIARLFLSICLCLITGRSFAQDYIYATGNPSFAVNVPVENGFINITNGNLHMEFPLATHKQRGALQLNERLVYDSRIWRILPPSSSTLYYGFFPSNIPTAPDTQGGWRFVTGAETGTTSVDGWINQQGYCEFQSGYQYSYGTDVVTWSDPSGTSHTFDAQWPENHNDCNPSPSQVSMTGYATDGSGYSVQLSGSNNAEPSSIIVHDNNGNQVYPQVIDRFGNYWSNDSNGNLVDDLNRTPVLVSTNGSVTYYDVLAPNGPINNNGTRVRYTVTTAPVSVFTQFNQSAVSEWAGTFYPVQSIQLPDGSSYSFTYDSYGEMSTVTLPTGGVITYGWTNYQDSYQNKNRWLTSRTVGSDPATTFTPSVLTQCSGNGTGCQEKVTVHKPSGDETVYQMTLCSGAWNTNIAAYTGAAGGTPIATTANTYSYNCAASSSNYVTKSLSTTTLSNGLATQTQYVYDAPWTGKMTALKEWDYFTGSPSATPTRETDYSYSGFDLSQVQLSENGSQIAQTNYDYISSATVTTGILQHGTTNAGGPYLQKVRKWLNTDGSTLDTSYVFDDTGTVLSSTDPNGQTTYGHDATNTFITSVTAPTPSSGVVLSTGASYDVGTGALNSTSDENSGSTTYQNYDSLGRPQLVTRPDGGTTAYTYSHTPNAFQIGESSAPGGGLPSADTETLYDPYGRVSRVAVYNGQRSNGWYQTDYCYDSVGNLHFQSTAYQGTGFIATKQCSGAGTTYSYDALNRIKTINTADGNTSYDYQNRAVKVTDVNGVQKITQTDALGRITAVCEGLGTSIQGDPPQSCGLDIAGTGYLTTYSYDPANFKMTVTQGIQQRVFQTDSLGRTTYVKEPESGETRYSYLYTPTGLQVIRERPKANTTDIYWKTHTTTQYDKVGRPITISYDDGTPTKAYYYDQATAWGAGGLPLGASKGRLTAVVTNPPTNWIAGGFFIYDPMGRVTGMAECTLSGCGNGALDKYLYYTYDYHGNMLTATDGAGVTTTYQYSPASEVQSVTSSVSDATHPSSILSNVQNGPFGPNNWVLGNGLTALANHDAMGRNNAMTVCSNGNCGTQLFQSWSDLQGNNVNWRCDSVLNRCDDFSYDGFGRMTSMQSYGTNQYTYTYDRYGNRLQQTPNPSVGGITASYPVDPASNQVNSSGFEYDAAGNVTNTFDGVNHHTYDYDAEGNVIRIDGGSTATYYYNAFNQRIRADIPGSGSREYIYNISGQRVSVWDANTQAQVEGQYYWGSRPLAFYAGGSLHFQHQDWLGTERWRTSYNGGTEGTFSSLPFGDGFSAAGSDDDDAHFAQLDRDPNNTHHAQFRQYSSTQGRWMSPDPYMGSYDFSNPQSLNRYAYVGNSPLTGVDPSGLAPEGGSSNPARGCIGAVITLGAIPVADAGCATSFIYNWFRGFLGALGGPSFNGTTQPRPGGTIWDEHGGFHASPYSSIAAMIGDVDGISSPGCEFGACGSGFAVDPNQIEQHHVFAQELVDWFRTRGLGDLTNLTIPLTAAAHRLKSGLGVHTNDGGNWNRVWREFRARYPNATRQQIIDQAKKMLIEFGIGAEDTLPSLFIIVNPCVANPAQPMCQTGYNLTMPIDTITPQPVTAKGM